MVFSRNQPAPLTDQIEAQKLLISADFVPSEHKSFTAFQQNYKTELCRNWESGYCEFGDKCTFAHGKEELRTPAQKSMKYKTKKCKQFHTLGYCMYGPRCQFIHTEQTTKEPPTAASSRKNSIDEQSEPRRLPIFLQLADSFSTIQ